MKRLWKKIPRKIKICINLLAIAAVTMALYILIDCPAFTPAHSFRRLEKANLLGPAEILGTIPVNSGRYDHLMIAEDDTGITLYGYSAPDFHYQFGQFVYREKTQPVTVLAAPSYGFALYDRYVIQLPVLVFQDNPRAVRAELTLEFGETLDSRMTNNGRTWDYYRETLHLTSTQRLGTCFVFTIRAQSPGWHQDESGQWYLGTSESGQDLDIPLGNEGYALEIFSEMCSSSGSYFNQSLPATVRTYDEAGNLLAETSLMIRSQ